MLLVCTGGQTGGVVVIMTNGSWRVILRDVLCSHTLNRVMESEVRSICAYY